MLVVIIIGNGHKKQVQMLDLAVYLSHSSNTLGKGMNPIILLTAMSK